MRKGPLLAAIVPLLLVETGETTHVAFLRLEKSLARFAWHERVVWTVHLYKSTVVRGLILIAATSQGKSKPGSERELLCGPSGCSRCSHYTSSWLGLEAIGSGGLARQSTWLATIREL